MLYRVRENDVETVTVEEDGVLVSKTINGHAAALQQLRGLDTLTPEEREVCLPYNNYE